MPSLLETQVSSWAGPGYRTLSPSPQALPDPLRDPLWDTRTRKHRPTGTPPSSWGSHLPFTPLSYLPESPCSSSSFSVPVSAPKFPPDSPVSLIPLSPGKSLLLSLLPRISLPCGLTSMPIRVCFLAAWAPCLSDSVLLCLCFLVSLRLFVFPQHSPPRLCPPMCLTWCLFSPATLSLCNFIPLPLSTPSL